MTSCLTYDYWSVNLYIFDAQTHSSKRKAKVREAEDRLWVLSRTRVNGSTKGKNPEIDLLQRFGNHGNVP